MVAKILSKEKFCQTKILSDIVLSDKVSKSKPNLIRFVT